MCKHFAEAEEVREALSSKLSRPVSEAIWNYLVDKGYVSEVLDCLPAAFNELVSEAKGLQAIESSTREKAEHRIPARYMELRSLAVSALLARDARRREEVKRFREELLGGKLLTADMVPAWIKRQSELDGPPGMDVTLTFRICADDSKAVFTSLVDKMYQRDGKPVRADQLPSDYPQELPSDFADRVSSLKRTRGDGKPVYAEEVASLPVQKLDFPDCILRYVDSEDPGWPRSIRVNPDGVLGRLQTIATKLSKDYNAWAEVQTVQFILTDEVPHAGVSIRENLSMTSLIILHIPPWFTDAEVAHSYRLRSRIYRGRLGRVSRTIDERTSSLVVFVCAHEDVGWQERCRLWNAQDIPDKWRFKTAQAMNNLFCRAKKRLQDSA